MFIVTKFRLSRSVFALTFAAVLLFMAGNSFAQFKVGKNTAGVLAGFGGGGLDGTGSIPISLEYNFYNYGENIQGGLFASYAASSEDFNFGTYKGEWDFTYIIIAAQGNYHFSPGKTFDPFVGLSLGYNIGTASWKWSGASAGSDPASATVGGFFWNGQAGFNYWFSDAFALQVRAGYYPYIAAGITLGM